MFTAQLCFSFMLCLFADYAGGLMNHFEFGWETNDYIKIYAQDWEPPGEVKAVISLVHGLGEHSGRYSHLASYLTRTYYDLITFEVRGHGKAEGQRGFTSTIDALLEAISQLLEYASNRFPDLPRPLCGHSLGGTLVLNYVVLKNPTLAGVVATGPLLRPAFEIDRDYDRF